MQIGFINNNGSMKAEHLQLRDKKYKELNAKNPVPS